MWPLSCSFDEKGVCRETESCREKNIVGGWADDEVIAEERDNRIGISNITNHEPTLP